MATCKACVHYDVCIFHLKGNENEHCVHFINTADVVEVVRCENCDYHRLEKEGYLCLRILNITDGVHFVYNKPNDFCSYGTPKERGGEK